MHQENTTGRNRLGLSCRCLLCVGSVVFAAGCATTANGQKTVVFDLLSVAVALSCASFVLSCAAAVRAICAKDEKQREAAMQVATGAAIAGAAALLFARFC